MENEKLGASLSDFWDALSQVKEDASETVRKEVSSKFNIVLGELYDAITENNEGEGKWL